MSTVKSYERQVFYYETDQMGIVHHSNYIRWMEEARINYLDQVGLSYKSMEAAGILVPVLAVEVDYLRMLRFGDKIEIDAKIKEYNGIKMTVVYEMTNLETGKVHCRGLSKHCFLSTDGRPLSLKQSCPSVHDLFMRRKKADKK